MPVVSFQGRRQPIKKVDAARGSSSFQSPQVALTDRCLAGKFCLGHAPGPPHFPEAFRETSDDLGVLNRGFFRRGMENPSSLIARSRG